MAYEFGPFRLDPSKRRLWRSDELVSLTPKAFDTLLVLVTRPGEVVEKEELLKTVWPDTFVEEATVAQNISTIRKALGDTSDTPTYIATVPRRGYRFLMPVTTADAVGERRVQQVVDAAALRSPASDARRRRIWKIAAATAMACIGLLAVGARFLSRTHSVALAPIVFTIAPPDGTTFSTSGSFLALSPNGRHIAFLAVDAQGSSRLWIRSLATLTERVLDHTDNAAQPFWSADSRFVAFFADGKLKKVAIANGAVQIVCEVPAGNQPLAGTWNDRDDILFASLRLGILRVSAAGGTPRPAIANDSTDEHAEWPQFLPDQHHFLYVVSSKQKERSGIYVGDLDSAVRTLVSGARSFATYSPPGYLLFLNNGMLVAQPFDADRRQLSGEPVPIADEVAVNAGNGRATFSSSSTGLLAYRTVSASQLEWVDRSGIRLGMITSAAPIIAFAVSHDATQIAVARVDRTTATSSIWLMDHDGRGERRLTGDGSWETRPLWSPDDASVVFTSNRLGRWQLFQKSASGVGPDRQMSFDEGSTYPLDWSRDGRLLVRRWNREEGMKGDVWLGNGEAPALDRRVSEVFSDESSGRLSPDGRWVAYEQRDATSSIYVRSLLPLETQSQIAPAGGAEPRWRADGRELYYLSQDLAMMAIEIEPGVIPPRAAPRRLFQTHAVAPSGIAGQAYDVSPDGRQFLVKTAPSPSPITVVVNWTALVSR